MTGVSSNFIGEFASMKVTTLDELYGDTQEKWIPMRLKSISLGCFEYDDGEVKTYGEYKLRITSPPPGLIGPSALDVFVFHSTVKPYGKSSVCFSLPKELSLRIGESRYSSVWCVQIYGFTEEDVDPSFTYQKFMRKMGGNDCIPIPQLLAQQLDRQVWTVVMSRTNVPILAQYDGFIYPTDFYIGDMFGFHKFIEQINE